MESVSIREYNSQDLELVTMVILKKKRRITEIIFGSEKRDEISLDRKMVGVFHFN
jgi:hypothetical protein